MFPAKGCNAQKTQMKFKMYWVIPVYSNEHLTQKPNAFNTKTKMSSFCHSYKWWKLSFCVGLAYQEWCSVAKILDYAESLNFFSVNCP